PRSQAEPGNEGWAGQGGFLKRSAGLRGIFGRHSTTAVSRATIAPTLRCPGFRSKRISQMRKRPRALAACLFFWAAIQAAAPASPVGSKVDNLKLTGLDGKESKLYDLKGHEAIVLVFLSFDCPVARSYAQPLAELARDYGPRKIAFLGVFSTEEKS